MTVRTLVIDTATAACSIALWEGDAVLAEAHDVVGRGHAERLVPMIADLPGAGRADHILVDVGPGSFTGLRVGLAAAVGLSIGWRVPVTGYSSLPLIALGAVRAGTISTATLAVAIEGGHGELFVQRFALTPFSAIDAAASLRPDAALARIGTMPVVGNGARLLGDGVVIDGLPRAGQAMHLPAAMRDLPARPIYLRAPDAKPQPAAATR